MKLIDFMLRYKNASQEQKEKMKSEFLRSFPISMKEAEQQIAGFYIDDFCNLLIDYPELIALDRLKLFKHDYIKCGYVVPDLLYSALNCAESETEESPSIH